MTKYVNTCVNFLLNVNTINHKIKNNSKYLLKNKLIN